MDKFWKDEEEIKVKCIECYKWVVPIIKDKDITKREICPKCGATIAITFKGKKLEPRDW